MFKFYEVGGAVRDSLLGVPSKDIDYVAVPELEKFTNNSTVDMLFDLLVQELKLRRYEIYLITAQCFTIRAKNPSTKQTADFVLARKEIGYKEGTREPIVVPGTLYDDMERRDFTINALARDGDGHIIDYFGGLEDLRNKVLKTPIKGNITFSDDPLRLLRAIRFAITKNMELSSDIESYIHYFDYEAKFKVVSEERIREELYKCFKYCTISTLYYLSEFDNLRGYIFRHTKLWLKPTNEQ